MRYKLYLLSNRGATKIKSLLGAILLACAGATLAQAQTDTWNNGNGDFLWNTPGNWDGGVPTSTSTALFDTLGAGTVSITGTVNASTLQFGNSDLPASYQIGSNPGLGTINLSAAGVSTAGGEIVVQDAGLSTSTASETIDSNLVFGAAASTASSLGYAISNLSGGTLTVNGNFTNGNAGTGGANVYLTNSGTGNLVVKGNINTVSATGTVGGNLIVNTAVGTTVTLSGQNTFSSASTGGIDLGSSTSSVNGDLVLTNNGVLGGSRIFVYGTQGAIQLDTAGNTAINNTYTLLYGTRASATAPEIENVSGNNVIQNLLVSGSTGSHYIEADGGLLTVNTLQQQGAAGVVSTVTLDGSGNGLIASAALTRSGNTAMYGTMAIVKDGTGTWTYGASATASNGIGAGGTTTVAGGTLLVDGKVTGVSTVAVNNTSNQNATLGGTGSIAEAVVVSGGGTINPGDVGVGAANIGVLSLTSNVTVGGSTSGILKFDLDSDTAQTDQLALTGNLTLTSGQAILSVDDLGNTLLSSGSNFTLVAYGTLTGTFNGYAPGSDITVGQNVYSIDYGSGSGSTITLDWVSAAAVPEPSTLMMLMIGGLLGLALLNRRRSSVA